MVLSLNTPFQPSDSLGAAFAVPFDVAASRDLVAGLDCQVPLITGRRQTYLNADNAATTPTFHEVLGTMGELADWAASVHRGEGFKSLLATDVYQRCHDEVARFVGADPATHAVIFCANTTQAINLVSRRLRLAPGERIVTTLMEHHSNLLPWRRLGAVEVVGIHPDGSLDLEDLEGILRRHRGRVRLVAVSGASNVTGHMPPLRRLARLAHEHGAQLLVDAAQLVAHQPIAMGEADDPDRIDFLAFSAHKAYAPFGVGALLGPRPFFTQGDPVLVGGGTVKLVTTEDVEWAELPDREEAGTPNVLGAAALAKALRILERLGLSEVARHEQELTARLLRRLQGIDGVRVFGDPDPGHAGNRIGVVPIQLAGYPPSLAASILSYEHGIGVRPGCFCAQPYVAALLGLDTAASAALMRQVRAGDMSGLPGFVRISLGLYNTAEEIDRLCDAIESILRHGPRGRYRLDPASGRYQPEKFTYDLADYVPSLG